MLELAPHLEAVLNAGQTIVVPTAQRAAALRLGFAAHQLQQGRRAFRTPDVQSLSGWLRGQSTRQGADSTAQRRLGASEEWLLWRAAVAEAAARLSLPPTGLVDAVRQAAALLFEWRIPPAALRQSGTPEALLLSHSLEAIDARLAQLGATAPWRALQDLAREPPAAAPLFAGFGYLTPARGALLAAWAQRGTVVAEAACTFAAAPGSVVQAPDPATELALVAQWCRARLSAAPTARLLVIVPDLAQRQAEVRRVFDEALDPGYLRADLEAAGTPYAVEGGRPLLSYAPIAAGLSTLQLLGSDVELAQISQWLRGGFWLQPDASRRALLDVWLRSVVPPRLRVTQLLQALRAAPPALLAPADEIAALLVRLQDAFAGGSRAGMGTWSGRFAQVLALCGLHAGAARQRGSHAQQVLLRLDELLQECAALPPALGMFNAAEALTVFTQLLTRTRFEPATGDAPVTVTASLADPVLRYDGIWVSGLHAEAIPERARFDPLIPVSLQRQAGIFTANAAALVGQAQQALQTLCRSSHEFLLSAPAHADDLQLAASPLLAPYAHRLYSPSGSGAGLAGAIRASRQVESLVDERGAPWPDGVPLPAGTRAIELQSRCPFRAYAQLRLGAEPLESPEPGITPRERGRLLHRALELLWQRLGGSSGLAAARAEQAQSRLVSECVAQAASEILRGADTEGGPDGALSAAADATGLLELRRAAIERELGRAGRLINTLCDVEADRAPFRIHELEAAHRLVIAGALINVRIDRVDEFVDGTHAILDYKSGRALTPDWEVARTTHPQLLVYLLAAGVPVSTLAVAHLDPKAVLFKGIGDADSRLPGVKGVTSPAADPLAPANIWSRQLGVWNEQVAQLAGDFVAGLARVDPMDGACDYCHLHAFCRIADLATAQQETATAAVP
ncbi:MAG TPA: PD-(D/E)XK nuclease family protein [Steroidobacteraceae bacterium]